MANQGTARFWLERRWGTYQDAVAFVMLNPSTANDEEDDATIRACTRLAKAWDYSALIVVNTNPMRSTDPRKTPYPTEFDLVENDEYLRRAAFWAHRIVFAWGNNVSHILRDRTIEVFEGYQSHIYHLGFTKQLEPRHPLYAPTNIQLKRFYA